MKNHHKRSGFTIIELLTVIAIIAVLAAILLPIVGRVRLNAQKTAARAQFSQWGQSFELFRQEYGFYPSFGGNNPTNPDDFLINGRNHNDGTRFYETLTGRRFQQGDRIEDRGGSNDPGWHAGNTRATVFYSFADYELEEAGNNPVILDYFGNRQIVVLFDRNLSGSIEINSNTGDYNIAAGNLPEVESVRTGRTFRPTTDDFPNDRVRAGVIFYSAGVGEELFMSWK
jgi:prepilin-type N-terminal cleavage/methylation domain-containing protein